MARGKKSVTEKYNLPFASRIRQLMDTNGTTQDQLAEVVDKTRQTISQYVNGISEPGYDTLVKIADYFGVSVDYLLGRTQTKTPDATMQAIIDYTGLSEENIKTLHYMVENAKQSITIDQKEQTTLIDGCKPFLDCLNDILDAVYYDKETIMRHYITMRRASWETIDFWYIEGLETPICGVPAVEGDAETRLRTDNASVEYACMKIARGVERSLKKKYIATDTNLALMQEGK